MPETVFVNAQGVVTEVYFGAIPNARLSPGVAALNVRVSRSEKVRAATSGATKAHSPRASQSAPVGAVPWPSTRCSPSAIAPEGSAMATRWMAAGNDVSGTTMPEKQQQHQVEAVAGGEVDFGAQPSRERQADPGQARRTQQ